MQFGGKERELSWPAKLGKYNLLHNFRRLSSEKSSGIVDKNTKKMRVFFKNIDVDGKFNLPIKSNFLCVLTTCQNALIDVICGCQKKRFSFCSQGNFVKVCKLWNA